MGNLGAHVKSVHHLPFSKKLYQESLKVVQSEQQHNNSDVAAGGALPLPEGPTLAPPAGDGASLQSPPGASPPMNAPTVLYDKKTLLEHYQKKVYQEPSTSSSLSGNNAGTTNNNGNSQDNNNQEMNRPSSGVQSPQMLVAGVPVTSHANSSQDIRSAPPPSTTSGIQTRPVPGMVHNMHDLARYQDIFAHPQQMMATPDLSYAPGNLPLPYRPLTGPLHGSPM